MKSGLLSMAIGLLAIAIGLAATQGSQAFAGGKDVLSLIPIGAAFVGVIAFLRGLRQFLRAIASADQRAVLRKLVWPQSWFGRLLRLCLVAAIAAGGFFAFSAWQNSTPASLRTFTGTTEVKAIAYSPDGKWLATAMDNNGIKLWNLATGEATNLPGLDALTDIDAIAFSPDGHKLAVTTRNGLHIWQSTDWAQTAPSLVGTSKLASHAVAFSPDGSLVATGSNADGVLVWDAGNVTLKWQSTIKNAVFSVAFSYDGHLLAAGHDDGLIDLRDAATGTSLIALRDSRLPDQVTSLAFFHSGYLAAASNRKPAITVWSTRSGSLLKTFEPKASPLQAPGNINALAASPDDAWIAAGSSDGTVRFWDAKKATLIRTISTHADNVTAVAFAPDGKQFAAGGSDNAVDIWAGLP